LFPIDNPESESKDLDLKKNYAIFLEYDKLMSKLIFSLIGHFAN